MENRVSSVHYCGLLSKGFPETPVLSLRLYCLETMSLCLASAINERQILYFTYVHERSTEPRCYSFLFIRLRLQPCCIKHFLLLYIFHVCIACGYFISHTFISEHWLCYTFSTHLPIYFFLRSTYEWIA